MKKLFTLFFALVATSALWAHDFEVDGIYYKILNGSEVEVTYGSSEYSGSVAIPETVTYNGTTYSVTSIGVYAFCDCDGLTSVNVLAEVPPTLGNDAFYNVSKKIPVYVPCEFLVDYQEDEGWSYFTNIQCISEEESAVDDIHISTINSQKLLRNGQLIIIRDGVEYNAQGVVMNP